ncbi:glycosyltransferase family 4 protein [Rhizobium sp. 9140]|uniref:glycosyltransferase family 4 protein n=1 Tax=Rhizobium sp. 9140 TaxID=1761900 RepID=UPI000798BC66|nr:glycosyltransferase family 4 protein [Rhizobium sp. 9140]CZT34841.1 Glycosyltransferase involved in cell wall bisynthesis [Rhizobium sp. 9140]
MPSTTQPIEPPSQGRPLRIIHCFRSPVGGIFRHVRDLAAAHAAEGHHVGILCDSSTGGAHEERLFEEIRPHLALGLVRLPIRRSIGPSDARALWASYKELRQLRPDILHGHGAKGGALARMIGTVLRINGSRVARLYSPHGGSLHYDRKTLRGKGILALERFQEHATDALVFVCDFERRTYEAKVGQPRPPAVTIYNGVEDAEFVPVEPGQDAVDFLYIGMLRDMKGPDIFIDALGRTERLAGRPLSAMMIGDGPQQEDYLRMKLHRGLGQRIGMAPAMPAREAFSRARFVVVPSRAESMPYIVLEAVAAGRPVIAARVGGMPEILGADSAALAEPNDAQSLAGIMHRALTEDGWATRTMPDPEAFRATFSSSTMAASMMQLYRRLANDAGG